VTNISSSGAEFVFADTRRFLVGHRTLYGPAADFVDIFTRKAGIEFIDEDCGGPGVRLKKNPKRKATSLLPIQIIKDRAHRRTSLSFRQFPFGFFMAC
jgi:hypothetical protein